VLSETSREKEEAYQLSVREKRIQDNIGNVLDPLLKIIAKEYIDHVSLTSSLSQIFHFMLTAVGAQNELTCNDLIRGISKMNFTDEYDKSVTFRMHMTKMDYDTITKQGALAKDNGALGAAEFDMVMRKQVHDYIKRKLQRSVSETDTLENFAKFASLKALVMDVEAIKAIQSEMRSEIKAFHLASELQGENCREMMHAQMKETRSEILSEMRSEMKALHLAVAMGAGERLRGNNLCEPAVCADASKAVIFSRREKRHEKRESAPQGGTTVVETRRMAEEEENVRSAAVEWAERIAAEDEERKTRLSRRRTMLHIDELSSTTGEGLPYRREWELSSSNAFDTLAAMLPVP
jgi:urease accessory protein UreF